MFKLISLKAIGFKRLDLEEKLLFPDGRVLVHGRNESGKSTLMEAIHYALYGMPLRPSKNAGNEDIISYGREKATIELEFSIEDTIYQVHRDLFKKKTNYHLLNKREPNGDLTRVATGARNVNDEISEILHGIDSDALLNSCLVEQKELGKLESSTKQERIKAMSSLLNLEAFIDSRDNLKKDASDLDKTHKNTLLELQRAEQAKQDYESAEKRLQQAETRLQAITAERLTVQERLEQLEKDIAVIQQMKIHQTKINEAKTKLDGKKEELKILKNQLTEVEKAEEELEKVTAEIPAAETHLADLEKQLETVQTLTELQEKIDKTESSIENINVRLTAAERAHIEAQEAKERVTELNESIKEYSPVRKAAETLAEL
ncbi:MAG: AAA family ATPase, partial [Candidatus Bathyarchaeota archaeon]|nr:AAA family ATPase [Candidatus Bathyarchaeota archaeon]